MAGISWLATAQNWINGNNRLDALRFRASYGTTGKTASSFVDAFNTFSTNPSGAGTPFTFGLKPEVTAELEFGVDASLFNGASSLVFDYYRKNTTDALVPRSAAPSANPPMSAIVNGLSIQNTGAELSLVQRLMRRPGISAGVTVLASANKNRITAFPSGVPPVFTGNRTSQKNTVGYPLYGLWSRTYSYNDANRDGIITLSELTFGDTAQFVAPSYPTRNIVLAPTLEFPKQKLRLSAVIDNKSGFRKFNNTLRHQCQNALSCRGVNDRSASLATQAAAVAASQGGVFGGMYEDASFTRITEASALYEMPRRWANALRATSWSISLSGRNLGLFTRYSGTDPEASQAATDAYNDEFFSTPPTRHYLLRFNFVF